MENSGIRIVSGNYVYVQELKEYTLAIGISMLHVAFYVSILKKWISKIVPAKHILLMGTKHSRLLLLTFALGIAPEHKLYEVILFV